MRPLTAALALIGLCSCSGSPVFQPGDCVVHADGRGDVLEVDRSAVRNTPMRVLAEVAPGKYLVEWETIWLDRSLWLDQPERNQRVLPARGDVFHLLKVPCPAHRK